MSIFKRKTQPVNKGKLRYEVARYIYSGVIGHCLKDAHWRQDYERLPEVAAKRTVEFADALIKELEKKGDK